MIHYTLPIVLTFMNMTGHLELFLNRTSLKVEDLERSGHMNLTANITSFEYDDILYDYLMEIAANNERYCHLSFAFLAYPPTNAGQIYCNSTWDSVTCWPTTAGGRLAEVSCPSVVDDIKYDSTQNATRMCFENGTWQEKSDYTRCAPLTANVDENDTIHNYATRVIYYVGFTTSLVALVIALSIFLYFRSLRCLRNTIHCHLIVTFMVRNALWMVINYQLLKMGENINNEIYLWVCKLTMTVYNYMQVTNFFWMLVEGLYLHTLIVFAFSVEKIKFWYYAVLGWCVPGVVIIIWAVVKAKFENERCWLPMEDTYYDYIYIVPILIVLFINVLFLGSIVCVMMSKLRASNTLQTRQYRKAVRATLILFPLLGVTYLVFITPPNDDIVSKNIFVYFNAVLQSTQGLLVAVFYCFMNGEVRAAIKQKFTRWQDHRSIRSRYSRASIANAEQIGLKRASVGTTTSAVGNGRLSSGSVMTGSSKDCVSAQSENVDKENGVNQLTLPMLRDEAV